MEKTINFVEFEIFKSILKINLLKVDTKIKFIDKYKVTDASVHDSQPLDELLTEDETDRDFYADSDYINKNDKQIRKRQTSEKRYRNKPLTDVQKANKLNI